MSDIPAPPRASSNRALVAAILGNALELYDFVVYAIFAVTIGKIFFPVASPFGQLMLSVSAFGIGFIMRPLGAFVLGAYADRKGRKAALTVTILLMALGTGLLGITPGVASIGLAAPLIIVAARLLQGFSAGGELGAATTYLLEMAPPEKRGYYASWQSASQALAILCGSLLGFFLSKVMSHDALESWGWRIPFLLGLLIAPVGFYIRSQLDETLDTETAPPTSRAVLGRLLTDHRYDLIVCTLMITGGTVSVYVISNYMTTYARTVLHLPVTSAMLAGVAAGITGVFAAIYGGKLSDRFGRRKLMIVPLVVLILAIYPAFLMLTRLGTPLALVTCVGGLTIIRAMGSAVVLVKLAECFPPAVRSSGVAVAYSLGVTIFGGSTQPIVTWLIHATGNPMAPAWYLIVANLVTLGAILALRDRPDAPADTLAETPAEDAPAVAGAGA